MPSRIFYTLFMVLAAVVFLWTRYGISKPPALIALPLWKRVALVLAAFVGGAVGAKLPFVLSHPDGWAAATTWLGDGKTLTTCLACGYLAVELAKLALDIRVKTGDTFALPLALALAVGRWGCFFNGCCYGIATDLPWGVDFGDGVKRHPTQVYESLFHLTMAAVLWQTMRRGTFCFQRLKLYLIAYCAYRFVTEFIRPEPPGLLGLTFYQWTSLMFIAALGVQWVFDARQTLANTAASTPRATRDLVPHSGR
jgi:phosphatidylglycerol:prolipoprotein diacylglycerol transferase